MRVEGFYVIGYEDENGEMPAMAKFQRTWSEFKNFGSQAIKESWGDLRSADRYLLHRDAVREAGRASERLRRKVYVWCVEVHAHKEGT